jgi:hypothetical protein
MDDMDNFDLLSAEKVAAKYGGDKRKIGEAAQMGLVNPTVAVMAGMFIDRMRAAAIQEQQPSTTVAQDTFTPPVQMAQAGLGATPQAQAAPQMPTQMAAAPAQTATLAEGGLTALPVDDDMFPDEYAGGGIVAFARGDLVGQGINEPFEGESYGAYLMRRAKESLRGPFFSEEGTMPRAGMSESQADFYNQGRTNQALFGDILSGKAPVPVRSADPTLMREATPPGYYADETTRGTARRVAQGGPGRSMEEFGIGAAEMAARRDADEAAKKAGAGKGAASTKKEETSEDMLDRIQKMRKRAGVSEDPFAADREALRARMDDIASQDKENKALAMIMGGLSGVGARNLTEFAQKAGTAGFGQYMKGKEKTREEQKEIDKINRDLNKAEDAMKRGDVDKALEFEDKAESRRIQLMGVEAQRASATRPSSTAELMAALQSPNPKVRAAAESILGRGKTGVIDERFLMERWEKMNPVEKLKLQQQGIGYDQWAASKRAESGGAAGAPAAGGRVIDFGSIR